MKVYRYWARARGLCNTDWDLRAVGRSNTSEADALARAKQRVIKLEEHVLAGGEPWDCTHDDYGYLDGRPIQEELIEDIERDGARIAAITRNKYGALILNTQRVMFADIDDDGRTLTRQSKGLLARLFGSEPLGFEERTLERIEGLLKQTPGLGVRVYRTARGIRCLITSGLYDVTSPASDQLLKAFGSDRLYVQLCKAQECFRARLTAKPWRCGLDRPPVAFPYADTRDESLARAWEVEYHEAIRPFAACRFMLALGSESIDPEAEQIITLHDDIACLSGAKLA